MSATHLLDGPSGVGVNITPDFYDGLLASPDLYDFLEIDPELFVLTPTVERTLAGLARRYPFVLHSTSLSICGDNEIPVRLLDTVEHLADILSATVYSDHLSFTRAGQVDLDLYMAPVFDHSMLDHLERRIRTVRDRIGPAFALENVGQLFVQSDSDLAESDFLLALVERTGVPVQLNLDSVVISADTLGVTPHEHLRSFPLDAVTTIAVVPETAMNVMLKRAYGARIDELTLELLDESLRRCPARRVVVQRRPGHAPQEFAEFLGRAREIYASQRREPS